MNESRFQERWQRRMEKHEKSGGRSSTGIFILLIGVAALLNTFVPELDWIFTWQMFLIALGVFFGIKNEFRGAGWIIMIMIGGYFLFDEYFGIEFSLGRLFWPVALIALGAYLIFKPRKKNFIPEPPPLNVTPPVTDSFIVPPFNPIDGGTTPPPQPGSTYAGDEILDVVAVFGAVKKYIYSKNFRGGEIVSVFGGAEVNLMQAGLTQPQVIIESVQVFGGAKLIVPADWVIHNEAVAVFGGIEDKRPQMGITISQPQKVLIIKGFVLFGGIEIKSY